MSSRLAILEAWYLSWNYQTLPPNTKICHVYPVICPDWLQLYSTLRVLADVPPDLWSASHLKWFQQKIPKFWTYPLFENIRMQQWFAASNAYHDSCRIITLCNSPQCLLDYTVIQICVIISGTFTAAMQTVQLTFVRKLQKEEAQPWMAVKALLMFCKI